MSRKNKTRYGSYTGIKRWEVSHPSYGRCYVRSPDLDSAMVAAAQVWGVKWTAVGFYLACEIRRA